MRKTLSKDLEENKHFYIAVLGTTLLIGTGFILGRRYQRRVDYRTIAKNLKDVTMFKKAVNPMFPTTMGIPEIKEALLKIDGATFNDALVATINGAQRIIVR